MTVSFDVSELRKLATDLDRAPDEVKRKIVPIMRKTGLEIRRGIQADLRESVYFKGTAYKFSVDEKKDGDGMEIEVYPHHGKGIPSSQYNIAVFGGANGGGGTVDDPMVVLTDEAEKAERFLADLLKDVI